MNELDKKENYTNQTFEDIKHIDENGIEYWNGMPENYKLF